ncbi:TetR/AcrR family transcriptional regulator [Adhaeribacter soli]|uniref:TetR/AcrR family transcriptional regulator n=2 Tax=Adhaeribacter soli TaxID=2607655 RepID=A0A5N1J202_9BACT|nr:TetR/AcrR family transcriptional regulator [Adhaeribacter soli]
MNFRQTVLQEGMNIFQQYGIRNLSMEAILTHLDISKGTLAGIARTKAELLDLCIEETLERRKEELAAIIEEADNAVEAVMELTKVHLKSLAGHHPDFFPDLKNEYQPSWAKVQLFSDKYMLAYLTELFNLGKEQELFKADIDGKMLSQLFLIQTNSVVEAGLLQNPDENFDAVFKMAFELYLSGLLTPKGLQLLQELTTTENVALKFV